MLYSLFSGELLLPPLSPSRFGLLSFHCGSRVKGASWSTSSLLERTMLQQRRHVSLLALLTSFLGGYRHNQSKEFHKFESSLQWAKPSRSSVFNVAVYLVYLVPTSIQTKYSFKKFVTTLCRAALHPTPMEVSFLNSSKNSKLCMYLTKTVFITAGTADFFMANDGKYHI